MPATSKHHLCMTMDSDTIISILSKFSRKQPEEIKGELSLGSLGLSASIGLSMLRSRLEAVSRKKIPPVDTKMTVNGLITLLTDGATDSLLDGDRGISVRTEPSPSQKRSGPASLLSSERHISLGMDVQETESLPVADDYRMHEFYTSHFLSSEIASAMLRRDPRAHLCGIFCAKEAAKKSHSGLLNKRMTDFIVSHDAHGRPMLDLLEPLQTDVPFQFILSITHTSQFSAAACLTLWSDA
ncbi:MAG: 4'-phosphopantetheinyl transferase superfamily protein [Chlorobiaceae bacterium]|nr:4'-phosphopantetheinyl transferase superfamily protein [Chlorobiaceae bacterium]